MIFIAYKFNSTLNAFITSISQSQPTGRVKPSTWEPQDCTQRLSSLNPILYLRLVRDMKDSQWAPSVPTIPYHAPAGLPDFNNSYKQGD